MQRTLGGVRSLAALLSLTLMLAACGGGGDGGGGTPPPPTDSTPPTVTSTSPTNGATGVAVNTAITATFSEQMDATTVNTVTFSVKDAANIPITGTVSYVGTTATFTPSANLAFSTAYTATITTEVKDLAGNPLVGTYSWSFTIGVAPDTLQPTVISTTPADGASGISVTANTTATFSEAMDASTINTSTFLVRDSNNNQVLGSVSYSAATATFAPSANLAFATTYTATITTGAKDIVGNTLATDYSWTFITAATPTSMTVNKAGIGGGTVTSEPIGISCGSDCSESYPYGTQVTLTATPDAGSIFDGFSGGCSSIKAACTVSLTGDITVTANFNSASVSAAGNQLGLNGLDEVAVHQQTMPPPTSALDLSTFTIEAWIYPLEEKEMIIVADSAYYLMVKPQPLRVEFAVLTSTGFPAFLSFAGTRNPLKLNQWNHVVGMASNFSKSLRIAVNGELSGVLTMGGDVNLSFPQSFSVGNSYPQALGNYPFIGRIDEVRLSSVLRYFGNFTPTSLLDPDGGTVGLWHFDEAEGVTVFADSSGNGNTLTGLGGAATIAGSREVQESMNNLFYSLVRLNAGNWAGPVAIGDFNQDGNNDMAVPPGPSVSNDQLALFLSTGGGVWGPPQYSSLGATGGHGSIIQGDLNKDGRLDLVVSNTYASSISVLLGTGAGTFGAAEIVPAVDTPLFLTAGDFNNDGNLDIVVPNFYTATISILLGTGTGTFGAPGVIPVGIYPTSSAAGDFNSDGNLDVAVTSEGTCCSYLDSSVRILLGDGTGNFNLAESINMAPDSPRSLVTGDFNMDGNLDLAVANSNTARISIFLGMGTGLFNFSGNLAVPFGGPGLLEIADINQDGALDLAVASTGGNSAFSIFLGDGVGAFIPSANYSSGTNPVSVAIGELSGDGKPDLVMGVASLKEVHIYVSR